MGKRLASKTVEAIKSELRAGEYHRNIAEMFKCSKGTVDAIARKMVKEGQLQPYWSTTWKS